MLYRSPLVPALDAPRLPVPRARSGRGLLARPGAPRAGAETEIRRQGRPQAPETLTAVLVEVQEG